MWYWVRNRGQNFKVDTEKNIGCHEQNFKDDSDESSERGTLYKTA